MLELIRQPWHWSIAGFMISIVMLLLIISGKRFGVSSSFDGICSALGLGNYISKFNFKWRNQTWLFLFVFGSIIGGYVSSNYLMPDHPVIVNERTLEELNDLGVGAPSKLDNISGFMPDELFGKDKIGSIKHVIFFLFGGLLIGFGTRYAGGCTSGHAISGLSNFQMPSLIAVVGFFAGGLLMTHFILPVLLNMIL